MWTYVLCIYMPQDVQHHSICSYFFEFPVSSYILGEFGGLEQQTVYGMTLTDVVAQSESNERHTCTIVIESIRVYLIYFR